MKSARMMEMMMVMNAQLSTEVHFSTLSALQSAAALLQVFATGGGAGFRTWNFFGVWYIRDHVDLFIENVMLPIILLDPDQIMD